jgi:hypothetical protein
VPRWRDNVAPEPSLTDEPPAHTNGTPTGPSWRIGDRERLGHLKPEGAAVATTGGCPVSLGQNGRDVPDWESPRHGAPDPGAVEWDGGFLLGRIRRVVSHRSEALPISGHICDTLTGERKSGYGGRLAPRSGRGRDAGADEILERRPYAPWHHCLLGTIHAANPKLGLVARPVPDA